MKRIFLIGLLSIGALCCNARNLNSTESYDTQYRNKGIINNLEVGYRYSLAPEAKIVYENLGIRKVSTTNPIEVTYSIGYRFNNWISLSIGSGLTYEFTNLLTYGDKLVSQYNGSGILSAGKYSNIDIPLFIDIDLYLSKKKSQPLISLRGGLYMLNNSMALFDGGFGWNFRLSRSSNLYIMAFAGLYPCIYGTVGEEPAMGRTNTFTPGIKIGFTL